MFFESWQGVWRVVVAASLGYAALVFVLRLTGKRTLSKMNAFDLVVTVALGSSFATMVLSKQVAVVEGVVAFALLASLQYLVAWASVRSGAVERLVKSQPALVFYQGEFQRAALRRERITETEVLAALRGQGFGSTGEVGAVVLETSGELSVLPRGNHETADALAPVRR